MSIAWPDKDPDDILDFSLDWEPLINASGDTISSTTATLESGDVVIGVHGAVGGTQKTVTWLSGGTAGTSSIRLRINTAAGRRLDQTMTVTIAAR